MLVALTRLRQKLFYPLNKLACRFTVQNNQYKDQALLSQQVMNLISIQPHNQSQVMSLKDKIVETIQNSDNKSKRAKQQLLKLFMSGVVLNQNVFTQDRLKNARIESSQDIKFFPTHFTTGQIFNHINNGRANTLIQGHYGISKTFSFILYEFLSNHMVLNRMKYFDIQKTYYQSQNFQKNDQKNEIDTQESQLKSTRQKQIYQKFTKYTQADQFKSSIYNIILSKKKRQDFTFEENTKIPYINKLIYWSIQLDQIESFDRNSIYKKILAQCPEISQQLKHKENFNLDSDELNLKHIYNKKNINVLFTIDQINSLASSDRKLALRQKQAYLIQQKQKRQTKFKQIEIQKENLQKFIKFIKHLMTKFNKIFHLSSVNLQRQFIQKYRIFGQSKHEKLHVIMIDFIQKIKEQNTIQELIDFFIFQFGQRTNLLCLQKNWHNLVSQQNILIKYQIRSILKQIINEQYQDDMFFTNQLLIREILSDISAVKINQINKIKDIGQLKNELSTIFRSVIQKSYQQIVKKVEHFLNKKSPQQKQQLQKIRISIVSMLFDKALQIVRSSSDDPNINKFMFPTLQFKLFPNVKESDFIKYIDLNIFTVNYIQNTITMMIPALLMVNIFSRLKHKFDQFKHKNWNQIVSKKTGGQLGKQFQRNLINVMTYNKSQIRIKLDDRAIFIELKNLHPKILGFDCLKDQKQPEKQRQNEKQYQKFVNYKNFSFLQGLKPALKALIKSGDQCVLCEPLKIGYTKKKKQLMLIQKNGVKYQQIKQNSKQIDFIVIKCIKKKIIVYLMQVATGNDVQKKLNGFLTTFKYLQDNQTNQVVIKNQDDSLPFKQQKYQVQFEYYVIGIKNCKQRSINLNSNFCKLWNSPFKFSLLHQNDGLNIYNVDWLQPNQKSKRPLLTKTGYISYKSAIQITNVDTQFKKSKIWQNFQQIINKIDDKQ